MSTIASPRQSSSLRSPSSSRTSLELPQSQATRPQNQRRNRAALRDYYGLKATVVDGEAPNVPPSEPVHKDIGPVSELDRNGFDAAAYVKDVLAKEGLEGVLKVEGDLISEIKNLDGERKALVYDNYSKLIAATDTIRKMRSNMDPLTPATSTLSPAISHIAYTASTLSNSLIDRTGRAQATSTSTEQASNQSKKQTVRWVLGTPQRMEAFIAEGRKTDAQNEFKDIVPLLERWKGIDGVEELKVKCERMLQEDGDS
ncbi:hypothetical protein NA57DRAFT_58694 [Rhizodiscina lignyota]|uniref:Vacuolar protein sorting-associated protein 51 homolog n=1 Tax=Rhizodiscina lignyota TaxID=1504668 RepID=A0A9P4M6Z0_9PEZI|nr:hypothetical protein NA57DRAFT_58694 [Rhizodiscina lignyota]